MQPGLCCPSKVNPSPVERNSPNVDPALTQARAPLGLGSRVSFAVEVSDAGVAFLVDVVVDCALNGGAFLECLDPPKSLHRPLSSSKGEMGILRPVVEPTDGDL
jgi:hypothetical protein